MQLKPVLWYTLYFSKHCHVHYPTIMGQTLCVSVKVHEQSTYMLSYDVILFYVYSVDKNIEMPCYH